MSSQVYNNCGEPGNASKGADCLQDIWTNNRGEKIRGRYLLGHHHFNELLVVDLSITVDIGLTDHLVNLLIRQFLS